MGRFINSNPNAGRLRVQAAARQVPETGRDWLKAGLALLAAMVVLFVMAASADAQSSVRPPAGATSNAVPEATGGAVPGNSLGNSSDSEIWRQVRQGVSGNVSIPDEKAGILVQADGEAYRLARQGPLFSWLGFAMLGTLVLLALFFALRGRIRVEHGLSGQKINRFTTIERMGHWLMAVSFIILAITGLNVTFGKDLIMPIIGKEAFGPMSGFFKLTHNYIAFAFMLGLIINFFTWVMHNIPNRHDLVWLSKAGGLFSKNVHPPSKKFNAGQKIIFWSVMIGGASLFLSGWALLFPFEHAYFAKTFNTLAAIGIDVPAMLGLPQPPYTVIQEQMFNTLWHAIVAVVMICIILAHIYIGSVGMEGAFDAMGSGEVDLNWAKEHHSLWVEEKLGEDAARATSSPRGPGAEASQPAE